MTTQLGPKKLSTRHELMALAEAHGKTPKELSELFNYNYQYVYHIRQVPEYKLLVREYLKRITESTIDDTSELLTMFNREAPAAFQTLSTLHKRADRDATRLGAAKEILDRSTVAPRKKDSLTDGERGTVIQIGIKKMQNIITALKDVGDEETLELIEGEYEEQE